MKIWRVTLEQIEADPKHMISSNHVNQRTLKAEEYYQTEESAKKRVDEFRKATTILNSASFHASWNYIEVKP